MITEWCSDALSMLVPKSAAIDSNLSYERNETIKKNTYDIELSDRLKVELVNELEHSDRLLFIVVAP